jgi:hypothetical protein
VPFVSQTVSVSTFGFAGRRGMSQSRFIKWTSFSARRDLPSEAPLQSQRFTASMAVQQTKWNLLVLGLCLVPTQWRAKYRQSCITHQDATSGRTAWFDEHVAFFIITWYSYHWVPSKKKGKQHALPDAVLTDPGHARFGKPHLSHHCKNNVWHP